MKHSILINNSLKTSLLLGGLVLIAVMSGLPIGVEASAITPEKVLELVNTDRVAIGLPALTVNEHLVAAAEAKVRDMGEKQYFAHTSPEGKTPWKFIDEAGYSYHYAGENLAIRFTNAEDEQQAWLNSPTHRANILNNKFLETGIAVWMAEENGQKVLIVAEEFGTKPGVAIPEQPISTVLPGEVASSSVEVASKIQQPIVVTSSSVLEKMAQRIAAWTPVQLMIVFGLGVAEVLVIVFSVHVFRKNQHGDDIHIPIRF
jgi:hypothetical protein